MKTLYKMISIILVASLFLTGCEKDFDEINSNPNAAEKGFTPYLFTYAQRSLAFFIYDSWFNGRMVTLASQQMSQRNYTTEDRYDFRENVTNTYFRNFYGYLNNLEEVIRLNTDEKTKDDMVAFGDNDAQIASAMILKAWAFQVITDTWGDVPYSQALQPRTYATPKYDPQEFIYNDLIAKLKTAAGMITPGIKGWTSGDIIYNGNMENWRRFANTLRLRVALRMGNKAEAQSAISDGIFENNDQSALFRFVGGGTPGNAPFYSAFFVDNRNDFTMTKQFVNLMKGLNDPDIREGGFDNPFSGIEDPRLPIYRGPAMDDNTVGAPYGLDDASMKAFINANTNTINYKPASGDYGVIVSATFPSILLDYPTACFMVSEINNWDRIWFEKGVTASLQLWGVTDGADYVTAVMAKFDAATNKAEIVLTQKYIHLFTQSSEAWAEYRRTGYPKSIVKPGEVTYTSDGTPVVFEPINSSGNDIVQRFKYATSESTLNKENLQEAIQRQGPDTYATPVWWARK
ncbi:SusD/RagB family nutrient-binding outer membrane lipoprotein [Lentimicrobium sp.]